MSDVRDVDRDNEVNRILWAFKLNPYEKFNLRFDATMEEVKKQYRKLSLLVHPDKCKHSEASTAFDILGEASKVLADEEQMKFIQIVLETAREDVRKERKKATKHDSLVRVATMLNENGRAGVEAAYEQSDEFHEAWKIKAREYLAQSEWRRRKTIHRLKDDIARDEKTAIENKEKSKEKKEHDKNWEKKRDKRVNDWRDFASKKRGIADEANEAKDGKKAKKALGETKAPKLKQADEDKLYVQRPATEQFRPTAQPVQLKQGQIKEAAPGNNRPTR
ncbi:hypothetical protein FOA52_008146 [Chlamydomonas sp. UWO 241]|nr:hypothetical protein FOA52_008146 [Chlamydomonas sp. UWO 241]